MAKIWGFRAAKHPFRAGFPSNEAAKPKRGVYRRALALQRDALTEEGCQKIFTDRMSGAVAIGPPCMTPLNSRVAEIR
jgi:hypothetical protein